MASFSFLFSPDTKLVTVKGEFWDLNFVISKADTEILLKGKERFDTRHCSKQLAQISS